jgi:hypothetical protein
MKKKIKLRDMTESQFREVRSHCHSKYLLDCGRCPFGEIECCSDPRISWVMNKDLYSDKFLDQEVEIETDILTPKEKVYLEAVIDPFKERIVGIGKAVLCGNTEFIYFSTREKADGIICSELPPFDAGTVFKGMEAGKKYTLEELGL